MGAFGTSACSMGWSPDESFEVEEFEFVMAGAGPVLPAGSAAPFDDGDASVMVGGCEFAGVLRRLAPRGDGEDWASDMV